MPLTTPPQVRIGDDSTWHHTEWDTSVSKEQVDRGAREMSARDVQFWKWTVAADGEVPQVYRLLVAGPNAPATVGAVTVPAGRLQTRSLITDTPERIERETGSFTVTP